MSSFSGKSSIIFQQRTFEHRYMSNMPTLPYPHTHTHCPYTLNVDSFKFLKIKNFRMELTIPEQIAASVSGAGITALTMTPFDVVKGMNF